MPLGRRKIEQIDLRSEQADLQPRSSARLLRRVVRRSWFEPDDFSLPPRDQPPIAVNANLLALHRAGEHPEFLPNLRSSVKYFVNLSLAPNLFISIAPSLRQTISRHRRRTVRRPRDAAPAMLIEGFNLPRQPTIVVGPKNLNRAPMRGVHHYFKSHRLIGGGLTTQTARHY